MTTDGPHPLAQPIGHQAQEARLASALRRGRLHHAHLFVGPRGIGKAHMARRLAAQVMSGTEAMVGAGEGFAFDADAPAARRVAAGAHPDLMTLTPKTEGAKTIPVDAVRQAGRFLAQTPAEGGWRVLLIDAADDLAQEGANALLKSLEEPGRDSLIVLVSHSAGDLLPTIRSRCLTTRFAPLDAADMQRALGQAGVDDIDPERLAAAKGRPGRYLSLDDGAITLRRSLHRLLGNPASMSASYLHDLAGQVTTKDALAAFMEGWRDWLSHAIRRTATKGEGALPGRLEDWSALWEKTNRAAALADEYNLERRHVVLDALLDASRIADGRPISKR